MLKYATKILSLLCLLGLPISEFCMAWDGRVDIAFPNGNLEEVKRAIRRDPEFYRDPQMIAEGFSTAAASGNFELIEYLASLGWLEVCRKDQYKCSLIISAADSGSVRAIKYFLDRGFDINSRLGGKGDTAFIDAADRGHLMAVKFLCEPGVDANLKGYQEGGTALEKARLALNARSGSDPKDTAHIRANLSRVIEYLESGQCKAAPGRAPDFEDPLAEEFKAFQSGNLAAVRGFLAQRDTTKQNPHVQVYELYEAVSSGNIELLGYLKSEGWLDRCRKLGYCYPLHAAAATSRSLAVMEFLTTEGFDIDAYDSRLGTTPLQYAALAGHFDTTTFLCERGGDARKKLRTIPESSLLDGLLIPYEEEWCKINPDIARCVAIEGSPDIPPCRPGLPCDGVPFPPASQKSAQRVHEFNRIFQYLKTGQCKRK